MLPLSSAGRSLSQFCENLLRTNYGDQRNASEHLKIRKIKDNFFFLYYGLHFFDFWSNGKLRGPKVIEICSKIRKMKGRLFCLRHCNEFISGFTKIMLYSSPHSCKYQLH